MKGDLLNEQWNLNCSLPMTMGCDFAGIIESIHLNDQNSNFSIGEKVCGINWKLTEYYNEYFHEGGSFAEYILFPIDKLIHLQDNISLKHVVGLGMVGLTAYQILFDCAKITKNSKVLILGGSSAVGTLAIQLAKLVDAFVITTSSTRSNSYVRQFNPNIIINYQEELWENNENVQDLDAVIDTVGEIDAFYRIKQSGRLKTNGSFVSIASFDVGFNSNNHYPLSYASFYMVRHDVKQHSKLVELFSSGKLRVIVDHEYSFSLEGIRSLIRYQESGKSLGKNILLFNQFATYHGSCSCGLIKFKVNGTPSASLLCHCHECQQLLYGYFASFYLYPQVYIIKGNEYLISPIMINSNNLSNTNSLNNSPSSVNRTPPTTPLTPSSPSDQQPFSRTLTSTSSISTNTTLSNPVLLRTPTTPTTTTTTMTTTTVTSTTIPKKYNKKLNNIKPHSYCRVCGTCLYFAHSHTNMIAVLMTVLDDIPFRPTAHVFYDERKISFPNDNLPKYSQWIVNEF